MKPAIAYARVSTENQGESGLGLDAQLVQITQFAADSGFQIVEEVREVASATGAHSIRKRPKLVAAVILSRKEKWPIIVASVSRLSRNTEELERLAREGRLDVHVANIGGQASYLTMRSGVARAEHESREIKKRAARGTAEAKKRGVKFGNPHLPEARLKAWPKKTENAKKRRALFEAEVLKVENSGAHTDKQIAAALNERDFKNPSGNRWTEANVYSTRRRNKLVDLREAGRTEASALSIPVIVGADGKIAPDVIEEARAAMTAKGHTPEKIDQATATLAAGAPTEQRVRQLEKFMARAATRRRAQNSTVDDAALQEPNATPLDDGDEWFRALERDIKEAFERQGSKAAEANDILINRAELDRIERDLEELDRL